MDFNLDKIFSDHEHALQELKKQAHVLESIAETIYQAINNKNRVFLAGNGGSAADAQHIAAELTGRFVTERRPLPGIALTTDTSALTAIGNDYGFDRVFSRQLEGLALPGDVFIGISTSGNSPNILKCVELADKLQIKTVGFLGKDGGALLNKVDQALVINVPDTARVQEMHILAGHAICAYIDSRID